MRCEMQLRNIRQGPKSRVEGRARRCCPGCGSLYGLCKLPGPCIWAGSSEGCSPAQGGKVRGGRQGQFMCICCFVQLLSCVQLFVTPWAAAPGFLVPHHLLEFAQTDVH